MMQIVMMMIRKPVNRLVNPNEINVLLFFYRLTIDFVFGNPDVSDVYLLIKENK
jgi:hypothetical protein